jgi:Zn-dependent protease
MFSRIEVRDILLAWVALGFAFSLSFVSRGTLFGGGIDPSAFITFFGIALVTVGPGFVFHELSHKFVAQRYGFWAEFRMWPQGLLLALLTSLLGFIFAAPGATYISGMNISQPENGKISLAGPLTNLVIALLFLPLVLYTGGFLNIVGRLGSQINVFLALFNLLPIGPLDGSKVIRWNVPLWALTIVPLGLFYYFLITH